MRVRFTMILVLAGLLGGCGGGGSSVAFESGNTQGVITQVNLGRYMGTHGLTDAEEDLVGGAGEHDAGSGFRFVKVFLRVDQGETLSQVLQWGVSLTGNSGNRYERDDRFYSFNVDENSLAWIFVVPATTAVFRLNLPGGVQVDLTPLIP